MNRRAKFDAASFILSGEIRNRTNTYKQTVTDTSTPCLSARVDNDQTMAKTVHKLPPTVTRPVSVMHSTTFDHARSDKCFVLQVELACCTIHQLSFVTP